MKFRKIFVLLVLLTCFTGTACAEENYESYSHCLPVISKPVIEYDQWGNISKKYSLFFNQPLTDYNAWEYDENQTLLRYTRCLNDQVTEYTYVYDDHGFLVQTTISSNIVVEYENEYDEQGRILSSTSSSGTVITYEHAEDGSYKKIYDSGVTFEYGSDGVLDRECQPNLLVNTYDDRGNLLSTIYSDCAQRDFYTYSEDGKLLQIATTSYSGDCTFVYDINMEGRLVKAELIASENVDHNISLEYNCEGIVIRQKEQGNTYEFHDDATYKRVDHSDGSYQIYMYGENGQFLAYVYFDADGNRGYHQLSQEESVFFSEDQLHRNNMQNGEIISYTVYEHDAEGNLLSYQNFPVNEYTP